jgi:hypothetical protein
MDIGFGDKARRKETPRKALHISDRIILKMDLRKIGWGRLL